ncbi:hypothetical protein [Colwellia sp. C1TZA3]|uniref:hypothetical protein n=1 Tax=Colwellia sp. C1TZA3 TaxID=2508879 RepID=UPI001CB9A949|nr:hypothetical protein [Colwellia sp. C1TZA3]
MKLYKNLKLILITQLFLLITFPSFADTDEAISITVFLKHDQSKNLFEIKELLKESNFYKHFPPEGVEVESWKVMMGIGQVVTLRVPPSKLAALNLSVERYGWKAYTTEFYPTYDLYPIVKKEIEKARK